MLGQPSQPKTFTTKNFLAEDNSIKFYLEEDMTPTTRSHRTKLKCYAEAARSENLDVKVSGNKISIDGTNYGINDLNTLPKKVIRGARKEKKVNGGLAYRGRDSIYSSFQKAGFVLNGVYFNCVEQYYQYNKALICNNLGRADKICHCTDQRRIKELGDNIKPCDQWSSNRVTT